MIVAMLLSLVETPVVDIRDDYEFAVRDECVLRVAG
jgi:hypothetical protein